jgi:lysophospholipase L1-like esterase
MMPSALYRFFSRVQISLQASCHFRSGPGISGWFRGAGPRLWAKADQENQLVKISIFVLLIGFSLVSCSESVVEPEPNEPTDGNPASSSGDLYYLALGDSYTIGESVADNERYPVQLGDRLFPNASNKEVRIIAQTGWTTQDLALALNATIDFRQSYDLVSLLIGVNNQYQGRSLKNYKAEFRSLLEQAIELTENDTGRIFVISIPDYAYTPFGDGSITISQEIDNFNAANESITKEYGVQYFDITPISREGLNEPELVAQDGLHPSGEQYRRWVELMLDGVRKMLE